jgi:lipid-A-disaccharide synthase
MRRVAGALDASRPDAVILVDYPGLNLSVARMAHRRGIPVYYFVAPQLWAWAPWRARRFARCVDEALVIFPFEVPFFERAGIRTTYIGSPAMDQLPVELPLDPSITAEPRPVAILPGSRPREVREHLPIMLAAARALKERFDDVTFHSAHITPSARDATLAAAKTAGITVTVHENRVHTVMASCRCAIIASGTATLETALLGTPMVIFYRTTNFEERFRKFIVISDFIGQVNLVAGREICPEIIQNHDDPAAIIAATEPLLSDTPEYLEMVQAIATVQARAGTRGAVERAAALIDDRLPSRTSGG